MLVLFVYPIRMDWTAMPETAIHPIPIHHKGRDGHQGFPFVSFVFNALYNLAQGWCSLKKAHKNRCVIV